MKEKLWKFFFKDSIHVLAGSILFTAILISVMQGINHVWISILALIIAAFFCLFAWLSDYKEEKLMENTIQIIATVEEVRRRQLKVHMSTYHLADEDVIYPYVVVYSYEIGNIKYRGRSQWFWFRPCFQKDSKIKISVSQMNPSKSRIAQIC